MLHDSAFLSFLVLWFIFIFLSEIFFICLLKSIFKLGQLNIHLHFNDSFTNYNTSVWAFTSLKEIGYNSRKEQKMA